ncbi:MAG: CRTAC1 family protein [Halieaceae bacterium]|nr:CRTAC1 family protein [Halieaceae bacterium]MCP5164118.1 CRTAC1 family protein [Pseudomonadales bacterium]MCP5203806.1 CRTAC1 family protein [Pseudomonadales bacterium]
MHLRIVALSLVLAAAARGQVVFTEDAAARGLAFDNTDAQSVAWVDFNGDGWQDLWLAGHQMDTRYYRSRLYLNDAGQHFTNAWPRLVSGTFKTDAHGSYWADFDNDGDQDLLVVAGGGVGRDQVGSPNMLFENKAGTLVDRAAAMGLQNQASRGRIGLWLDQDGDGRLDIVLVNATRPDFRLSRNQILLQRDGAFAPAEFTPPRLQRLGGRQLLLAPAGLPGAVGASLDLDSGPSGAVLAPFPRRVVQADLDGDAEMDYLVYAPAKLQGGSCQARSSGGIVLAYLPPPASGNTRQFDFRVDGPVKLNSRKLPKLDMWLGDKRVSDQFGSQFLSPFDDRYLAGSGQPPDFANGIRIYRDANRGDWKILVHEDLPSAATLQFLLTPAAEGITLESGEPLCQATTRFAPYVVFAGATRRQPLAFSGLQEELLARGIVAGDFDNDGDQDLFVSRGTPIQDRPDVLLVNDGSGHFSVQDVAAANQYPEPGLYEDEIVPGPHIGVADYNNDGFLDIFQAASYYHAWLDGSRLEAGVPNRLLTNQGNANNWLQLVLEGGDSNRDAIGAQVRLLAGDTTQLRLQAGGIDSFDQHARPLHFGLGGQDRAQRIDISWPSGRQTTLTNVAANQILRVSEPAGPLDPG